MTAIITPISDLDDLLTGWGADDDGDHDAANGIFASNEIVINADAKTFYFKGNSANSNFWTAGSGVTGQALYSLFKERWKAVSQLPQYEFPMLSITNEQFEFINGWKPVDSPVVTQSGAFTSTTRKMIRTAGWSEVETTGNVSRRYFGNISLGSLGSTDQPYYVQGSSFTASTTNTKYTGPVNEALQFYGNIDFGDTAADDFAGGGNGTTITGTTNISFTSGTKTVTTGSAHGFNAGEVVQVSATTNNNGYFNIVSVPTSTSFVVSQTLVTENNTSAVIDEVGFNRSSYFKMFVRTRGKTYSDADLVDIGVTELTYITYRFPVSNSTDLNILTTDDAAFTGSTISLIDSDGSEWTIDTVGSHGLYVGSPITISGTTNYNGTFTVSAVTDANTAVIENINNYASETTGTVRMGYVSLMSVNYLPNPDTNSGDVLIRGDYANNTTYALGDVVYDNVLNGGTGNFYYVNTLGTGISDGDGTVASDVGITLWSLWTAGVRDIEEDGTNSAYTVVYEFNNNTGNPGATKEVGYEYAQYLLRLASDINSTAASSDRNGNIADPLVYFVGSQLHTYADITIPFAVVVDDISSTDVNNITYHDFENTLHFSPLVVLVTLNFNNNLSADLDSIFYAYYTTGFGPEAGNDYGSPGALQVQKTVGGVSNTVGSDVNNNVPNSGTYTFNYAYTSDVTNGRTGGTPVNITIVSIGLSTGQYVSTTGNITGSGATFSLVAPLERNYINPA